MEKLAKYKEGQNKRKGKGTGADKPEGVRTTQVQSQREKHH